MIEQTLLRQTAATIVWNHVHNGGMDGGRDDTTVEFAVGYLSAALYGGAISFEEKDEAVTAIRNQPEARGQRGWWDRP
jgi:hypothetical protein